MLRLSAVLILTALAGLAQDSWDHLQRLRPGDRVHVVRNDMHAIDGAFSAVTPDAITVDSTRVSRPEVLRVTVVRPARRGRNAAIGGSDDTNGIFMRGILAGVAAGGAVGGAFPPGATLYRAARRSTP